jgi:hypothetical protein
MVEAISWSESLSPSSSANVDIEYWKQLTRSKPANFSVPTRASMLCSLMAMSAGSFAKAVEKALDLCEESAVPDGTAVIKPYDHQFVFDKIRRVLAARDRGNSGE